MSNEMIERVAKAIQENMIGHIVDDVNELAKAAIQAMREPTEEMLRHVPYKDSEPPIDTYQRIIDAALKE